MSFHGWQYDKNGNVTSIPQSNDNNINNNVRNNQNNLSLKTLPVCRTNDLLWAFS